MQKHGFFMLIGVELCCRRSYGAAQPFGPFPVPRVKTVGLAVISALRYLHFTAGITHHDVKLGNVLAMKDGAIKVRSPTSEDGYASASVQRSA